MFPLRDANPRHRTPYVGYALLLLNILVFLYGLTFTQGEARAFVFTYGFIPDLFFSNPVGESYRLFTSLFLHGGFAHILGNMFFLYVFGDNIEDRMGHVTFLVFYLLGGVSATLAHGLFMPASEVPMIGASGAISAVLGAYIILFPRMRVLTFIPPFFIFWLPAWLYLGYWAIIQVVQAVGGALVSTAAVNGVAWWAHVGGFVFGALLVRVLAEPKEAHSVV